MAKRSKPVVAMNPPLKAAETQQNDRGFPVLIDGTTLIAASLAMYEGDMLEDDSEEFLVDAAALELLNYGSREVELVEVTLKFENTQMNFCGTNIPAGGRVLIIERDGASWIDGHCVDCTGWVQYAEDTPLTDTQLQIQDVDLGRIRVSNLTGHRLDDIWLFYKNYLHDDKIYLGGITYIEVIPTLAPGEQIVLSLPRYVSGYSKIIKARELG